MSERTPMVGDVVHVRHLGACQAAIVTAIDSDGTALHVFHGPDDTVPVSDYYPYNSLRSARPTSGWHWKEEHA